MNNCKLKKHTRKKGGLFILTGILMVFFLFYTFNMSKASEQTEDFTSQDGDWTYQLNENDEVIIKDYLGDAKKLVIDEVDGKKVVEIGNGAFVYCHSIRDVVIPDNVMYIGSRLFSNCDNLTSITINATVKELPDVCNDCPALEKVQLPEGLEEFSGFRGCTSLKEMKIPDSVKQIQSEALYGSGLESIFIPKDISNIGERSFVNCKNLKKIEVSPENEHFYTSSNMLFCSDGELIIYYGEQEVLEIPGNCSGIREGACSEKDFLKKIIIPDAVTFVQSLAFANCENLTEIEIECQTTKMASDAFLNTAYYHNDENWIDDVLYCGMYALDVRETKEYVKIQEGTVVLAERLLEDQGAIKAIYLPDTVQIIGDYAFNGCTNLHSVNGGKEVKDIGGLAFGGTVSLEKIYLQADKVSLEILSFLSCNSLKEIIFEGKNIDFAGLDFYGCSQVELLVLPSIECPIDNIFMDVAKKDLPKDIVFTDFEQNTMLTRGDELLSACEGRNIYLNYTRDEFAELIANNETDALQWTTDNVIYFKEEYNIAKYYIDQILVAYDVVKKEEKLMAPTFGQGECYIKDNSTVYSNITWDTDGDNIPDELPEYMEEDIIAQAIYEYHTEHTLELISVLQESTCGVEGKGKYLCSICGLETEGSIEKTNQHNFSDKWIVGKNATCTEAGLKWHRCTSPGCEEKSSVTIIMPKDHSWGNGVVILEPEIGVEGIEEYTCLECGEIKEEKIKALSQTTENEETSETPTSEGEKTSETSTPESEKTSEILTAANTSGNESNKDVQTFDFSIQINKKGRVILRWNSLQQGEYYEIYCSRKKNKAYKKIATLPKESVKYIDKSALAGRRYYYRIYCFEETDGEKKILKKKQKKCYVPLHIAPKVSIRKRKEGKIGYIEIRMKKYKGSRVEIQYHKGDKIYRNLRIKTKDIKRMKGCFKIRYLSQGEKISVRVRTILGKGKKKQYSRWSKEKIIQT